jgi:NAD(P) transhydrogenase subunit alpha
MTEPVPQTPDATVPGKLIIGIPRETAAGETRVSLIPEAVARLTGAGVDVVVEAGAGEGSSTADAEYAAAGATVVPDRAALFGKANLVVKLQAPNDDEVAALRPGTTLVAFLAPLFNHDLVRALANQGVTALAMDAVPRITRAQSMDALSAMTTISGYKAVLLAASALPKFFPLLMTAAGTIRPAKVLVLGAGVAGLQAIATARRLGAVVEAYDTRPVVKEQVESLGAKFVEIDTGSKDTQDSGGYARQATAEELRLQQEGLNAHIADADVVITTALVPGRPAPKLIPASAVEAMRTGSVIVDLAAETGGNCELTAPGEVVVREGVTIIGTLNLPATMPVHASQMYSRVIQNLLGLLLKDGQIDLNLEDDIIKGMCITHGGTVIQEQTRKAMNLDAAPPPAPPEPPAPAAEDVTQPADDESTPEEGATAKDTTG